MNYIKYFENFEIQDDKVGKRMYFEYHCLESPESCDAELWYRSHQQVNVLSISDPGGGDTYEQRLEEGYPRTYKIKFDDGFEGDAFEDELFTSSEQYYRPDPPKK